MFVIQEVDVLIHRSPLPFELSPPFRAQIVDVRIVDAKPRHSDGYWKESIIKRHGLLHYKNRGWDTNEAINLCKIAMEAIFQREKTRVSRTNKMFH